MNGGAAARSTSASSRRTYRGSRRARIMASRAVADSCPRRFMRQFAPWVSLSERASRRVVRRILSTSVS